MKQELTSLSKFLDFRVNDTILQCTLRRSDGQFHRQRRKLPFDLFTNLERIKATEYVLEVNNLIYQINNTSRWHTDRYSSFFTQIIFWLPDVQQNRLLVDRIMGSKRRKARGMPTTGVGHFTKDCPSPGDDLTTSYQYIFHNADFDTGIITECFQSCLSVHRGVPM